MSTPSSRTLVLALGSPYLLFGVAEVVTHLHDTAGALVYWGREQE